MFADSASGQSAYDLGMQQAREAYRNGDFSTAVAYTEQALEKDSLQLEAHILRGSSHLALKQPVFAEHAAGEGLRHFPEAPALKWIRAEALLQQNRLNQAQPVYEELYRHHKKDTRPDRREVAQRLGLIHQVKGNSAFQQKELEEAEQNFEKAREYMPDSLHSYHNLALVYLQREKWQEALKVTAQGLVRFPGNEDLLRMRANALYRTEDYEGVLDQYRVLYEQEPGDPETALQYAQLLMAGGDTEKAYSIYNRLLEKQPKNRKVYESLAEVYEQRNDMKALRSLLRKMKEKFPNDVTVPEQIARTHEVEEEWNKARQVYDSLRVTKKDPSVELAIGRTWEQQDSLQAALEVYSAAVKKFPEHEELLRKKGETEEELGLFEEARITYRQLLSIEISSEHHIRLGRVLEALNKAELALDHYEKSISEGTNEPFPYYRSARILRERGDRNVAFGRGETALVLALSQVEEQQQLLTSTLQQQGNLFGVTEAGLQGKELKEYEQLAEEIFYFLTDSFSEEKILPLLRNLEQKYPDSGRMLYLLSTYYKSTGDEKKQFSLLRKSVELSPRLAEAHLELGNYQKEQGQAVLAIQSFERALSSDPGQPEVYSALIQLYRKIGKLDSLIERWKARYRVRPESEVLRNHLIEALHKAGRYEEARKITANE